MYLCIHLSIYLCNLSTYLSNYKDISIYISTYLSISLYLCVCVFVCVCVCVCVCVKCHYNKITNNSLGCMMIRHVNKQNLVISYNSTFVCVCCVCVCVCGCVCARARVCRYDCARVCELSKQFTSVMNVISLVPAFDSPVLPAKK